MCVNIYIVCLWIISTYNTMFVVARPSSLIDCQTGEMLLAECISRDLKRALDQYDMSMNENFNSLTR